MSAIAINIQQWLGKIQTALLNAPLTQKARNYPLVSTASITATALIALYLRNDYLTFLSIGRGGLPYNVFGWMIGFFIFKPIQFGAEARSPKPYLNSSDPSYLSPNFPPKRSTSRPTLASHPVPQRQITQLASKEVKLEWSKAFNAIATKAKDEGLVELKKSKLELRGEALFALPSKTGATVTDGAQKGLKRLSGEFAHLHATGDHSAHVMLSISDCTLSRLPSHYSTSERSHRAFVGSENSLTFRRHIGKKVFDAGWGERHAFDDNPFARAILGRDLPVNYVLIYAPRNNEEIEIVSKILKASIAYNTGTSVD